MSDQAPRVPISWLPEHPFHHGHPNLRDEVYRVPGVMTSRTEATVRNELGREYACIENIDDQVGLVLEKLKKMGELDNTYVFYTADHGIAVGRHGLMGKQNLYEHSWRVPFIVSGPGIKPGSRARGNNYLLDSLPTLCDLAGVAIPPTAQGKSLKPVLMGKRDTIREVMYGAYCGGTKPGMRSVRKGDWKLIKYDVMEEEFVRRNFSTSSGIQRNYYRTTSEPQSGFEDGNKPKKMQVNLADELKYAKKLEEMEVLFDLSEMTRLSDPYRFWDQPPDREIAVFLPPREMSCRNRRRAVFRPSAVLGSKATTRIVVPVYGQVLRLVQSHPSESIHSQIPS